MLDKENQIIIDIRAGKTEALDLIYKTHRTDFLQWLQAHYHCNEADALDIFQDSMIVLYRHVMSGKLAGLDSTLKTYLFGIGKRTYLNRKHKNKVLTNNIEDYKHLQVSPLDSQQLNDRQRLILRLLDQLGEPSRSILFLFYYKKYSLEAIAKQLGYSSKDVVKTQKVRCMKKLRSLVFKNYKKGDF